MKMSVFWNNRTIMYNTRFLRWNKKNGKITEYFCFTRKTDDLSKKMCKFPDILNSVGKHTSCCTLKKRIVNNPSYQRKTAYPILKDTV